MAHHAALRFDLPDAASARAVVHALEPEVADGPGGSAATVRADGATVHAEVEADTVSGLRAALNGVVRLLDAAVRSLQGFDETTTRVS